MGNYSSRARDEFEPSPLTEEAQEAPDNNGFDGSRIIAIVFAVLSLSASLSDFINIVDSSDKIINGGDPSFPQVHGRALSLGMILAIVGAVTSGLFTAYNDAQGVERLTKKSWRDILIYSFLLFIPALSSGFYYLTGIQNSMAQLTDDEGEAKTLTWTLSLTTLLFTSFANAHALTALRNKINQNYRYCARIFHTFRPDSRPTQPASNDLEAPLLSSKSEAVKELTYLLDDTVRKLSLGMPIMELNAFLAHKADLDVQTQTERLIRYLETHPLPRWKITYDKLTNTILLPLISALTGYAILTDTADLLLSWLPDTIPAKIFSWSTATIGSSVNTLIYFVLLQLAVDAIARTTISRKRCADAVFVITLMPTFAAKILTSITTISQNPQLLNLLSRSASIPCSWACAVNGFKGTTKILLNITDAEQALLELIEDLVEEAEELEIEELSELSQKLKNVSNASPALVSDSPTNRSSQWPAFFSSASPYEDEEEELTPPGCWQRVCNCFPALGRLF